MATIKCRSSRCSDASLEYVGCLTRRDEQRKGRRNHNFIHWLGQHSSILIDRDSQPPRFEWSIQVGGRGQAPRLMIARPDRTG